MPTASARSWMRVASVSRSSRGEALGVVDPADGAGVAGA